MPFWKGWGAPLMRCEDVLAWPTDRLVTILVRLPKPEGGARLIGLMNTLMRVLGRVRRPLSQRWEEDNQVKELCGVGKGRSSSSSAFEHNLQAELAQLLGAMDVLLAGAAHAGADAPPPKKAPRLSAATPSSSAADGATPTGSSGPK